MLFINSEGNVNQPYQPYQPWAKPIELPTQALVIPHVAGLAAAIDLTPGIPRAGSSGGPRLYLDGHGITL